MGQQASKCPCHHCTTYSMHSSAAGCAFPTGRQSDNEIVTQFDSALKDMRFEDVQFLFQTPQDATDPEYSMRPGGRNERTVRRRLFEEAGVHAHREDPGGAFELTAATVSPHHDRGCKGTVATRNPLAVSTAISGAHSPMAESAECDSLRPPLALRLGLDSPQFDSPESSFGSTST